ATTFLPTLRALPTPPVEAELLSIPPAPLGLFANNDSPKVVVEATKRVTDNWLAIAPSQVAAPSPKDDNSTLSSIANRSQPNKRSSIKLAPTAFVLSHQVGFSIFCSLRDFFCCSFHCLSFSLVAFRTLSGSLTLFICSY